ncbi:MAG: rhamnogalacturonan acetylesterase [Saprospiraceae bacterium]|nr:rhamnogalacturonan acetylesterase [Saprospiraceae bacterium]
MQKKLLVIPLLATLMLFAFNRQTTLPQRTLFLIGDSTMADKPGTPEENPERGWGQLLPEYFEETLIIKNHAVNGRSTRSFLDEGRWATVLDALQPGDYVFIQFGHNDQKENDPKRYTNPYTAYRRNLEKYVRESREKGANPVLLSSIVRRKFNENGTLIDTHGPYPLVTRMVAKDMDVPFIDLQLKTEDFVAALGPDSSKSVYLWLEPGAYARYPEGKQDDTHLNPAGARAFAGLAVEGIRELGLPLAEYLKK